VRFRSTDDDLVCAPSVPSCIIRHAVCWALALHSALAALQVREQPCAARQALMISSGPPPGSANLTTSDRSRRKATFVEEGLGTQLFARTTRAVSQTEDGSTLVGEARALLDQVDAIEKRYREKRRAKKIRRFKIGAIDSAASAARGGCSCQLSEDPDSVAGGEDDQAVAQDPFRRAQSCVRSAAGAAGQAPRIQTAVSGKRRRGLSGETSACAAQIRFASLLCSRSRGKARLSARSARPPSAKKGHSCAELGAERETTVDQTLIRGLVTAFRVFVSGLSSV
jgi:hypothetical protein